MSDPEIYSWHQAYVSAVLETDSTLISERIFEALVAMAQRLSTPMLIDGPEHTAMKAARRGLAALRTERVGGQSDFMKPLVWNPANRN
jgi:hypothetical protein